VDIATLEVVDVGARSATVRVAVTAVGISEYTTFVGVCFSTNPADQSTFRPNTHPLNCVTDATESRIPITGLQPATQYSTWAFAQTNRSVGVGQTLTFTTLPEPAISVVADPPAVSVMQGASVSTTLRVTRTGGYTGPISAQVSGLPPGLSAAGGAIGTGTSAALTFSATSAVTPNTYPATVTLTGPELTPRSISIPVTVSPAPGGFSVSLNPSALTVNRGGAAGSTTVNVTRSGAFTGAVSLSLNGVPPQVTAEVTSPGTGTTGALRFTALEGASAGTSTVTLIASGPGVPNQTATLALTVGSPTLQLNAPTQLQLTRGGSSDVTIQVFRSGWTGTVNFEVTGAPAGLSAQMTPSSTTGNNSTLRLSVGTSVAVNQTYTLTLRATGENGTSATANIAVQVQP